VRTQETMLDPRVLKSRSALEAALIELAKLRDPIEISVADIADRAAVARSTFYDHFANIQDLAESACAHLFDELADRTPSLGRYALTLDRPPAGTLTEFFAHFAEHAPLYRRLLGANGSARLVSTLRHRITTATFASRQIEGADSIQTHASDPPASPYDAPSSFLAGASLAVAIDWIENGCPGEPRDVAEATWRMLVAAGAVAEFAEPPPRAL
jgi:AcrR family transcriptional regulator